MHYCKNCEAMFVPDDMYDIRCPECGSYEIDGNAIAKCYECGEYVKKQDAMYDEYNGVYYCRDCEERLYEQGLLDEDCYDI